MTALWRLAPLWRRSRFWVTRVFVPRLKTASKRDTVSRLASDGRWTPRFSGATTPNCGCCRQPDQPWISRDRFRQYKKIYTSETAALAALTEEKSGELFSCWNI